MKNKGIILIAFLFLIGNFLWAQELSLDTCLQMARLHHPMLKQAELSVRRAEQVKMQAFTHYFPQVQGSAFGFHALHPFIEVGIDDIGNTTVRDVLNVLYSNYGEALGLDNSINLFQHGYMVGVTAVQPVFMGGKIIAGNQLAKVGVEAARLRADITERDQLEQVEESYWLVYGLQQKQSIIDNANQLLDTICRMVDAAVKAGLALPSDLTQVQIQRDEIARQQMQLHSGLRLARSALALSIGLESGDSIVVAEQSVRVDSLLPVDSMVMTAEHQLLALQIRAAQLEKRMALADALPHLAVGANYSYNHWQANVLRNGLGGKTGNGALFVTLNVPLTEWWNTGHKLKEKNYALEQARIEAEYIGARLDLQTKQIYDRMIDALAMMKLQQHTKDHAQQMYELTRANYEAGMTTITELLQAQTRLTKAQNDLTDAQIAYRVYCRRYKGRMVR